MTFLNNDIERTALETPSLDAVSQGIVRHLLANARASYQDMADELGVSRATIFERVKRLVQSGVIKGYHATIDWSLIGYPVVALVALETEQGQASYSVLEDLSKIWEVENAYLIAGRFDCLVKIHAKHHEHLQHILFQKIGQIRGFRRAETMVVLSAPLENNFVGNF